MSLHLLETTRHPILIASILTPSPKPVNDGGDDASGESTVMEGDNPRLVRFSDIGDPRVWSLILYGERSA